MLNPIFLEGIHEYDYRLVENKKVPSCPTHELYYSHSDIWRERIPSLLTNSTEQSV